MDDLAAWNQPIMIDAKKERDAKKEKDAKKEREAPKE